MRNTQHTLTLPELERVCALSEVLFAAERADMWVRFTYTKDSGETSVRTGVPAGCFGSESKTSVFLKDGTADDAPGKSFNLRNITNLEVSLR